MRQELRSIFVACLCCPWHKVWRESSKQVSQLVQLRCGAWLLQLHVLIDRTVVRLDLFLSFDKEGCTCSAGFISLSYMSVTAWPWEPTKELSE